MRGDHAKPVMLEDARDVGDQVIVAAPVTAQDARHVAQRHPVEAQRTQRWPRRSIIWISRKIVM